MKTTIIGIALTSALLTVHAAEKTWTGAVNSNWDTAGTLNWKDANGNPSSYTTGDTTRFDDTAANRTVVLAISTLGTPGVVVDAATDYLFYGSVLGNDFSHDNAFTFVKQGTGKVTVTNKVFATTGAGVFIKGGEMDFRNVNVFQDCRNDVNGGIHVGSGATLRISIRNPFGSSYTTSVTTPITVTNGNLILDYGASGHIMFGPLSLYNASVDYSKPQGYGTYPLAAGIMTFSGPVNIAGSNPLELTPDHAYSVDMFVHLWDEPLTEFKVDAVTGGAGADFTLGLRTVNRFISATELRPGGFVKSGPGTMVIANIQNAFTGNIEVREGKLITGAFSTSSRPGGGDFLGPFDSDNRTVTVYTNATLAFHTTYPLGAATAKRVQAITNDCFKGTFVLNGGTLVTLNDVTTTLPNLTLANGATIWKSSGIASSLMGRMMVQDTIKVTGHVPFVWDALDNRYRFEWNALVLNGYPENTFDIEDVTDNAEADATFDVPLCISSSFFKAGYTLDDWSFGFTKTGAGTMRLTAASVDATTNVTYRTRTYNGNTKVNAGALQVDGDISLSDTVRVAAGAYLAGTGTVNNVAVAAGGGFRAAIDQKDLLKVKGNLDLAGAVTVDLRDDAVDVKQSGTCYILEVDGTITGAGHLSGASVLINGEPKKPSIAAFEGNKMYVKFWRGLIITIK